MCSSNAKLRMEVPTPTSHKSTYPHANTGRDRENAILTRAQSVLRILYANTQDTEEAATKKVRRRAAPPPPLPPGDSLTRPRDTHTRPLPGLACPCSQRNCMPPTPPNKTQTKQNSSKN